MSGTCQPWVLRIPPVVGAFFTFDLRVAADPRPVLGRLRDVLPPEHGVLGLGDPLVKALGAKVPGLRPFPAVSGPGFAFPSTQGALWVFVPGDDSTQVFDRSTAVRAVLGDAFILSEEVATFRYREGRDLTGFVDGSANPVDAAALDAAVVTGAGAGLDGGSFVASQKYIHDLERFRKLPPAARDDVFGRRNADNEEMEDAPESAHVKRTEQEAFHSPSGFMVRRAMPWGGVGQHGTYFVAYGESLDRYERTLRRMAGQDDGVVDALLGYTRAVSGGYYWCPPVGDAVIDLSAVGL